MKTRLNEHYEQVALMRWLQIHAKQHPELWLCFAIPNAGNRHINYARKMAAEGLKSGVPDLFLPVARNGKHGLFVEMKTATGKVSETQKSWIADLNAQGYEAVVCKGWRMAALVIGQYVGLPSGILESVNS